MGFLHCLVILGVATCTLAFAGEYVPKSFFYIDKNGDQSDTFPIRGDPARFRRSSGNSGSYSGSFSSSGGGGGDPPIFFDGPAGDPSSFIDQLQSHINRLSQGPQGPGTATRQSNDGSSKIFTRFGEDSVHVGGTSVGTRGSFSSSSTSVDENGKVRYNVQTGKF